ncbi:MAG: SDR family NAD(P)-dependent oxidoreductase, partial [Myxococcota bacterium]|nr:SDR family NAD(P)-dependent oxidoreductase [Myxococcota bacterium]
VGADDVTNDALLPWIGAGFLATGAAATDDRAEDAALPFDRRRHGMLLGMGAVALVVETAEAAAERGITPLAEILATRCANSAGHALRLNTDHVAETVDAVVADVERLHGIDRATLADRCLFMSHETYTPARGGSASAEVGALRRAFGDKAAEVLVANTKGFTGHAMGAGLEEAVALNALVRREVPPIPNHREPDPDLGPLNLSRGGRHEIDYVLRLAAGFGSQVVCTVYRRIAGSLDGRIDQARHAAWLSAVTGYQRPVTFVEKRTLRVDEGIPRGSGGREAASAELPPGVEDRSPDTDRPTPRRRLDLGDLGGGFRVWGVVTEQASSRQSAVGSRQSAVGSRQPSGAVVVAHDGSAEAVAVLRGIEAGGAATIALPYAQPDAEGTFVEDAIAARLGPAPLAGRVRGIVNLLGLTAAADPAGVHGRARFLYHVARVVERLSGGPPSGLFLVTATANGGNCGIGAVTLDHAGGQLGASAGAAVGGVTKALAREWSGATVKVIDFAPDAGAGAIAGKLLDEADVSDGLLEIGAGRGGCVTTALSRTVELADPPGLVPESVVLVTGGAGGITAAIAAEIARRHRCRIAVLDIVARPPDGAEHLDLDAERSAIRSRLAATGERVTPARVEGDLAPLRRAKAAAEALAACRAAGAEVHYESCDLAERAAVEAAVGAVRRRFGRIDGVIHGAGTEESRPVSSKTPAGFDRVFRGKALGALHLWEAVRSDAPRFFVVFSSVAGRFGNPGQVDYCAANEVSARLAWHVASSGRGTRALAIDWTGWDGIGMAVAGGMKTLLLERGVDLLPPAIGVPLAVDLIDRGVVGEVVVCGRLGDMANPRIAAADVETGPGPQAPGLGKHAQQPESRIPDSQRRIPGSTVFLSSADEAVVRLTLDPSSQTFLSDHVIEGVPVLPGVVGLELMADAARVVLGHAEPVALGAAFERPVKAHPGRPVVVTARAVRCTGGQSAADCTLESSSVSATGRPIEAVHFRCRFAVPSVGDASPTLGALADLAAHGPDAAEVYRFFFHGPTFRVIERASRIGEGGIVVRAAAPPGGSAPIAGPRLREIALQAGGLWAMCARGVMALPHRIDSAERFETPEPGTPVVARARAIGSRQSAVSGERGVHRFDIDLLGEDGR